MAWQAQVHPAARMTQARPAERQQRARGAADAGGDAALGDGTIDSEELEVGARCSERYRGQIRATKLEIERWQAAQDSEERAVTAPTRNSHWPHQQSGECILCI